MLDVLNNSGKAFQLMQQYQEYKSEITYYFTRIIDYYYAAYKSSDEFVRRLILGVDEDRIELGGFEEDFLNDYIDKFEISTNNDILDDYLNGKVYFKCSFFELELKEILSALSNICKEYQYRKNWILKYTVSRDRGERILLNDFFWYLVDYDFFHHVDFKPNEYGFFEVTCNLKLFERYNRMYANLDGIPLVFLLTIFDFYKYAYPLRKLLLNVEDTDNLLFAVNCKVQDNGLYTMKLRITDILQAIKSIQDGIDKTINLDFCALQKDIKVLLKNEFSESCVNIL